MRIIRRAFVWLVRSVVVLVLLAIGVVIDVIWLTLPGGNITAQIEGLSAPVDIKIDADGVPRIRAASERDAAAAMGFLHARERMFQMDLMRRAARGELSEVVGPATLRLDRFNRTLGLRERVEADLATLSPDVRGMLESYASGVNAWIAARGRFSALEFAVLGAPRPWTAADSLLWGKTMGLYLSSNWRTELARLELSGSLTHGQIETLWPGQPALSPQAAISPALSGLATRLASVLPNFPEPYTLPASASNAWAVDGAHSATGAPLLAGDPHLGYGLPGIWYLARIETPQGLLVGATAPGVPFLVIGHNGHIAWSFTTTGADVQDLFIETPADSGYQTEQGPRPFVLRQETIHVRGGKDVAMTVRETRHGPVVSDLVDGEQRILAVSMANLAPGDGAADGLLALNRAENVAAAGLAAERLTSPVQNMMVADRNGIGFFVTGRVPIRRSGDGAFPANGSDGSGDWIGWAQGAALPHVLAPSSGRIVNANERVAPPDFPVFLGRDWFGDTRAKRIRAMLDAHPKATVDDFAVMQTDDLDLVAVELLPRLRQIAPDLADWNGRMSVDAAGPLVFNAWMVEFARLLQQHLKVPNTAAPAMAPWPDLVRAALSSEALCGDDCGGLLQASYDTAIQGLSRRFGPDQSKWHWGDAHQAVFTTLALRAVPVIGSLAEARIPASGSDSTVGRGGLRPDTLESVHGAAYRGVYDLADLDNSVFMVAPGQSGDPASTLARNFVRRWADGRTIRITASPDTVAAQIRLTP